jgi:NADPH-dependent dioxygenase
MAAKLPGKFTRLLMSQPADKADVAETPHHVFGGILAQHFDGIRFGETDWHSRWGSVVRLAHSYRRGAVFLAGDAAHTHSTAGGQGMNCCMQDAWNLGWKLGYVLKGASPENLLDTYERERKPIGSQVIGAASAIHELFMAGRNSGPEGLRALRDSGFLDELLGKVSGLSYHYRAEGTDAGSLPAAGDRMPNVALPAGAGGRWLTDLLRHTNLTLLAVAGNSIYSSTESWLATLASKHRGHVETRAVANAPRELTGTDGGTHYYLVRPDGYVAASSPERNRGDVERTLRELLLP